MDCARRHTALRVVSLLVLSCACSVWPHASQAPQLKTASTHPMQYYLSLPEGWVAGKKYPVVVVIDSAERDFLQAANAFTTAREQRPFILGNVAANRAEQSRLTERGKDRRLAWIIEH